MFITAVFIYYKQIPKNNQVFFTQRKARLLGPFNEALRFELMPGIYYRIKSLPEPRRPMSLVTNNIRVSSKI